MNWTRWIHENWKQLEAGRKLWLSVGEYGHPRHHAGFTKNDGWPVGQSCDYTMSMSDESRIHVQCFGLKTGGSRLRIHRDAYDPDSGLGNLLLHTVFETPVGPALGIVGMAIVFAGVIAAAKG